MYLRLTYRESLTWTQASGNVGDNVYRGNSIFDPDLTGTGGQPLGFDQWAALYATYTVLGSKCEVTSMANGGTSTNTMAGCVPTNFSTAFSTGDQERMQETPYSKIRPVVMGANSVGQAYVSNYMSTNKMLGVVRAYTQISDLASSNVTTNPSVQWFWHVVNYVPGLATQSLIQEVKITFFVVLETRQALALS